MKNVVLVSHGVQNTLEVEGYSRAFVTGVESYIPRDLRSNFVFIEADVNALQQERQLYVYRCVEDGLDVQWFRRLKHTLGSDVIWSNRQKGYSKGKDALGKKFDLFDSLVAATGYKLGEDVRVHAIGHSQGSQDLLEWCFDSTPPVFGLITMGSIISAKSGCYDDFGRVPPSLKYWANFLHPYDGISSKLEKVHPSKEIANFVRDFEVPKSFIEKIMPTRWISDNIKTLKASDLIRILMAHTCYWKSDFVHKHVADVLVRNGL